MDYEVLFLPGKGSSKRGKIRVRARIRVRAEKVKTKNPLRASGPLQSSSVGFAENTLFILRVSLLLAVSAPSRVSHHNVWDPHK